MRIAVAFRAIGDTALDKAQLGPLRLQHIGFAFGARGSGVGSACLAARRRHHEYDNGLASHGPACTAVLCVLGRHDGGNDVSDRRAHDPRFP